MPVEIKFATYSMWTREKDGRDYYDWCVFVDESLEELGQISWVEYELHPTYPDPVRRVEDRKSRFALMSSGWGNFDLHILIHFQNGDERETRFHLKLKENTWPRREVADGDELDESSARIYAELPDGTMRRWRKVSTLAKSTGLSEPEVEEILATLEAKNLVRRAFFRSLEDEDIWGSTAIVGVQPRSI